MNGDIEEVINALKNNQPVVALESTIISHGMPYPDNARKYNKNTPAVKTLADPVFWDK